MYKPLSTVRDFLKESNAIEDIWDDDSLKQALYAWRFIVKEPQLSISAILHTHKILMLHQHLQPDEKGYLRKVPVWIGGHEARPWFVIPELMGNWIKKVPLARTEKEINLMHVEFEAIHPFVDGNGRIGRILLNWQRIHQGLPILVIAECAKKQYYEWFE